MTAAGRKAERGEGGYNSTVPPVIFTPFISPLRDDGGKLFCEKVSSKNVGFASLIPRKNKLK